MVSEDFVKIENQMLQYSTEINKIQLDIINVFENLRSNMETPEDCDSMALNICNCVRCLLIGADTKSFTKRDVLVANKLKALLLQVREYDEVLVKEALDILVSRVFLNETPKKSR